MSLTYDFALMCPDVIAHNARVHTEAIAVVCDPAPQTRRGLDEQTNPLARVLRAQGHG